jgi:hypothetical protein
VRRVEGFQTFESGLKVFRKECEQEFYERFRVGESSEGFEVFEVIEGRQRGQTP